MRPTPSSSHPEQTAPTGPTVERVVDALARVVRYTVRDPSGVLGMLSIRADMDHADVRLYLEAYYRRHVRHPPLRLID